MLYHNLGDGKMMKKIILVAIISIALVTSSMAYEITSNDWGKTRENLKSTLGLPVSGGVMVIVADNSNQLSPEILKKLAATYSPRASWDNYLGGVPMASVDSYSFGPGGRPALKTTDPLYLSMGALPIQGDNLPEFLRR